MDEMKFRVGDQVAWKSQAGGYAKEKYGTVIVLVPAQNSPLKKMLSSFIPRGWRNARGDLQGSRRFDGWQRNTPCYIVAVPSNSGRGKGTLYCPNVKHLRLAE